MCATAGGKCYPNPKNVKFEDKFKGSTNTNGDTRPWLAVVIAKRLLSDWSTKVKQQNKTHYYI